MKKTNYYFISSPLHLIFSVLTALDNEDEVNVAVINYYIENNSRLFTQTLEQGCVFDTVISFNDAQLKSKLKRRKARVKLLKDIIEKMPPSRVYTGTDRSIEFQYAMHCASKGGCEVEGHYLDEGVQTYLGHPNMHTVVHNWIEPFLKKLAYGHWWSNPKMIGASNWISTVHAAFPELINPVLQSKQIRAISQANFQHPDFKQFNDKLLSLAGIDVAPLKEIQYVILLTGDSFYEDINAHLNKMVEILARKTQKHRIALKAHPRSKHVEYFKQKHPELIHIDNRVGFELLLPQFSDSCIFMGDISSTLFTIRWLKPEQTVLAVKLEQKAQDDFPERLANLLNKVGVQQLSYQQLV